MKLTYEEVSPLIEAHPDAGLLIWKVRPRSMFSNLRACSVWNSRFSGQPALFSLREHGYLGGHIFRKFQYAHRVMWLLATGEWPEQIDHKNGDRTDNRLENLQDVSNAGNRLNMGKRSDNKSGVTGVYLDKTRGKWVARVKKDGVIHELGSYESLDDAATIVGLVRAELGFSERHGK